MVELGICDRDRTPHVVQSVCPNWRPIERAGREGDTQSLPDPASAVGEDIQSLVINDIQARRDLGIRRYGQALFPHNGRNALIDAYEEALDLCMYLKQRVVEDAQASRS